LCKKCTKGLAEEAKRLYPPKKVPKEELKKIPGKRCYKPYKDRTPEEQEKHLLFQRRYKDLYLKYNGEGYSYYQNEYQLRYRINHSEKLTSYYKKRYESNPEAYHSIERRRRAREALVYYEKYSVDDVINAWGTDCYLCLKPIDFDAPRHAITNLPGWELGLHLDHVIPISQGGPDMVDNVKPTHAICNLRRSKKEIPLQEAKELVSLKVLNLVKMDMFYEPLKKGRDRLER